MELRVKDLQRYLMSNKISTKDCVGKFLPCNKSKIEIAKLFVILNRYFPAIEISLSFLFKCIIFAQLFHFECAFKKMRMLRARINQ